MGDFRIVIDATGGHGCQREIKDGGQVYGCQSLICPDCLTRDFVERLARKMPVRSATFIHWPGEAGEVVDDLLTRVRRGSF